MAAGSIVIELLAKTGSFETDTKRAEARLKKFEAQAKATGAIIGTALVAAAGVAAVAFDRLVKSAANFKDLEETTGASAEGLASLAVAVETAGLSMDEVAGASIRLTKNLTGVDDESKAAGAAIKALGLDLAAFKALDPVAQTDALTAAFAKFADGTQKTAVATALYGKAGAEQLKLFKALEEQGGRQVILTQDQIEAADAYADAQARAGAQLKLYAQAAATQALPAISALTGELNKLIGEVIGVDKETGKLAANNAVRQFGEAAAVGVAIAIEAVVGLAKAIRAVAGSFESVFADAEFAVTLASKLQVLNKGGLFNAENRAELAAALEKRNQIAAEANERYVRLFTESGTKISDALRLQFSEQGRILSRIQSDPTELARRGRAVAPAGRPELNFRGTSKAAGGSGLRGTKDEVDALAKAINALEEELAFFGQDEAFKKAFALEGLGATNAQLEGYRANLAKLKELKNEEDISKVIEALSKERDEFGLTSDEIKINELVLQGASEAQIRYAQEVLKATDAQRKQKELMEEGKRITEEFQNPLERLLARYEELNKLLREGAISQETYGRAVLDAQTKFDEAMNKGVKEATKEVDSFTKKFAENMQDFLGQGLYDALNGNFKNIGKAFQDMVNRMVAEAAAAELSRILFGDLVKGGSGGGLFGGGGGGGFLSAIGDFFGGFFAEGGDPPLNKVSIVGEKGPEFFVPRTAGTIVPMKAAGPSRGGDTISITIPVQGSVDRQTREQIASEAARQVQVARSRNTAGVTR